MICPCHTIHGFVDNSNTMFAGQQSTRPSLQVRGQAFRLLPRSWAFRRAALGNAGLTPETLLESCQRLVSLTSDLLSSVRSPLA